MDLLRNAMQGFKTMDRAYLNGFKSDHCQSNRTLECYNELTYLDRLLLTACQSLCSVACRNAGEIQVAMPPN